MKVNLGIRKVILSAFTLTTIVATTFIFQHTQSFYKYFTQGNKHFEQERYYEALPFLISAFKMEPQNMKAATLLLWNYEKLGMKKEAKNMLNVIWKANPEDLKITEELGDAYYSLSNYNRAEELYRRILEENSKRDIKRKLAEVLVWQKKYSEAIPILEQLKIKRLRDFEFLAHLADVYSWAKEHDKAIKLYKKLLSHNYNIEDITLKLADELRYVGRDEEAIELYNRYLKRKK